jgi:hypothetical protein
MVQGNKKLAGGRPGAVKKENSAKSKRKLFNQQKTKKGSSLKLPKSGHNFYSEALEDRDITKAIGQAIEQKIASKVVQAGGKIGLRDVMEKGKEMRRQEKRKLLKRKKSRLEEKLIQLKEKLPDEE